MKMINAQTTSKLIAMALVLSISACATKNDSEEDPEATGADSANSSVQTGGADEGNVDTVSTGGDSSSSTASSNSSSRASSNNAARSYDSMSDLEKAKLLQQKEFHFGFDSFRVGGDDQTAVYAHGKFLAKTPVAKVRVEGHTDEQGTREYNLALGERRAKAVQRLLMSAGAKSSQIEVITFGEERPKSSGSSDSAYSENRRVDLNYTAGRP